MESEEKTGVDNERVQTADEQAIVETAMRILEKYHDGFTELAK